MRVLENIPIKPRNIKYDKNTSLRLKVCDCCPLSCKFCHHEGNDKAVDIVISDSFLDFLKEMKKSIINEIHLTGGEPTSYKRIVELVDNLVQIGFKVKMTTNGYFDKAILSKLKNAGLNDINFSVHTLNPYKLGLLQKPEKDNKWGLSVLSKQLNNIELARKLGLKTKINTVFQSCSELLELIGFCKMQEIELRVLDDLTPNSLSIKNIIEFLTIHNSTITGINFFENSSSYSYDIKTAENYSFKIKNIRKFILRSICNNCQRRDLCQEWFYGIRLEQFNERNYVRLCIHRQDYPAFQTIEDFVNSEQYTEVKLIAEN